MTGAQVRILRERCQLSLRGLARILRVHWVTIWRWEHDRHAIPRWRVRFLVTMARCARPPVRPCSHCGGTGVERSAQEVD